MVGFFEAACIACLTVIGVAVTVITVLNDTDVAAGLARLAQHCIVAFSITLVAIYVTACIVLDPLDLIYGSILRVVVPAAILLLVITQMARFITLFYRLDYKSKMLEYELEDTKHQLEYELEETKCQLDSTKHELANATRKLSKYRLYLEPQN